MMDSHSFGATSGFQRVTKSWNSRGSKSGRSRAAFKKTRGKTSKRQTKKRLQERDDKQLLKQDYEVMQHYYRDYDYDYRCYYSKSNYRRPDTIIANRTPTMMIDLHLTTFCSPTLDEKPPQRLRYQKLAPTKEFQILGGGVSWLSSSVFEEDVLLVLATFVPEIGFGGFAHQTYKFPKLHENSKAVTYAINPVSLYTVAKEEEEKEKPKDLQWKIVKRKKKDNEYAPTPCKEFSWSCKFTHARRSDEDFKFLQSQGMRCQRTSNAARAEYHPGEDTCGERYHAGAYWVAEMGFEDLETLFEASLIPSEVSEEQIKNLGGLIGTCAPQLHRERNEFQTLRFPEMWQRRFIPTGTPSKRSIRVEAYAGVNKNLKVFFCMSYFITNKFEDDTWSYMSRKENFFEIYCFDLHEFLCVLSKVNCILEIREYGKFVYEADVTYYPEQ